MNDRMNLDRRFSEMSEVHQACLDFNVRLIVRLALNTTLALHLLCIYDLHIIYIVDNKPGFTST